MSGQRPGARARAHVSWWAFAAHRASGVLLALFLPIHLWALSRAIHGAEALDAFLRWTDQPLFRFAEWGLAVLLTVHLGLGLRLLWIEFRPWGGMRKGTIGLTAGAAMLLGIAMAVALLTSH